MHTVRMLRVLRPSTNLRDIVVFATLFSIGCGSQARFLLRASSPIDRNVPADSRPAIASVMVLGPSGADRGAATMPELVAVERRLGHKSPIDLATEEQQQSARDQVLDVVVAHLTARKDVNSMRAGDPGARVQARGNGPQPSLASATLLRHCWLR